MTLSAELSRRKFLGTVAALSAAAALPASALAAAATGVAPINRDSGTIDISPSVVILNGNEYPSGPTPAAVEAMHRVAINGNRYYMSETTKFTAEIASYHGVKPANVSLYAGSSEPLRFTTMAFVSPTKSLVTADPTFESAGRAATAVGATVHKVPLKSDWSYDMKAMVAADPNAGLYYVCNPNNPTGAIVKRSDIEWLLANKAPGSVVLVDEAYIHFSDAESVIDLVAKDKDLVVIRTFSKIYSMGGLRFGYATGRPDLMEKLRLYGVNSMATTAIQCARVQLNDKQLVPLRKQAIADARDQTFEFLSKKGYAFTPSQANHFLLDAKHPGAAVAAAMAQHDIIIGRTWPSKPTMPRITVGSLEQMKSFQSAFLQVQDMPAGKVTAAVHPYPHLLHPLSC